MLVINVLAVAAGLLMGLCKMWKPHLMVIAGRAIMGFYCGEQDFVFFLFFAKRFGQRNHPIALRLFFFFCDTDEKELIIYLLIILFFFFLE